MRVMRNCESVVSAARNREGAASIRRTREPGKSPLKSFSVAAVLLLGSAVVASAACLITNEASLFYVTSVQRNSNGSVTITWQSCPDHAYLVASTSVLATNTTWTYQAAIAPGQDAATSWIDTSLVNTNITARFYRVDRLWLGDTVGDGIPDWWRQFYFGSGTTTNSLTCATCDYEGDGVNNLTEYLQGRDPKRGAVPDTQAIVNLEVFTPLE